jgi:tetratricopeptide (TPR) repeat protein
MKQGWLRRAVAAPLAVAVGLCAASSIAVGQRAEVVVSWEEQALKLLGDGDFTGALVVLNGVAENGRRPWWFIFVSNAHVGLQEKNGDVGEKKKALAALDEGLRRYPASSRLLLQKAMCHIALGEAAAARKEVARAKDQAKKNIADDRTGTASADDRSVLEEAAFVEKVLSGK